MKPEQDSYRLPIEHLPDAFAYHQIILDDQGNPVDYIFLVINNTFEEMTGLKREEIIGKKVTEILPGIEKAEFNWINVYGQVALSGKANRFESFSEPLGRWYDVSVYSDKPGYFGVFFHDIGDRKKIEHAQQDREPRFQRMLKVIPDMVSVHDPDLNIVYSNWIGFAAVPPEKQILNTKCYKTYRNYDQICPDCQAIKVLESKEAFQTEVELSKGYWIDLRVIPLLDSSGEVEYFIEWVRDISDLKKIEEELRLFNIGLEEKVKERTAQLEASNRELDAFSYSVSHDLRGPLNRIEGFSLALLEDYAKQLDQQGQDYLRRISNSSRQMAELIDDLLKLSKVSRMEIYHEPIELSTLVNDCLKELQTREPQRKLEITVTPGLLAEGDTALLRIVMENLLDNAWKFTRQAEKAQIEFGLTEQTSRNTYYIRDNGAGFDMKHAEKLFSAFQRLHTEQEFSGTGIGLSIVSRIIKRHGSEIWAEGEPGKGACFYFTLP